MSLTSYHKNNCSLTSYHKNSTRKSTLEYQYSNTNTRTQVPKQENSCDCGIFMLTYVEYFFRVFPDARYMTTQHLVDKLSAFVNENWFTLGDIGRKRREIRGVFDKFRHDGN